MGKLNGGIKLREFVAYYFGSHCKLSAEDIMYLKCFPSAHSRVYSRSLVKDEKIEDNAR